MRTSLLAPLALGLTAAAAALAQGPAGSPPPSAVPPHPSACKAPDQPDPGWRPDPADCSPQLRQGEGWAILAPPGWASTRPDQEGGALVLQLAGGGQLPFPRFDGTLQPLEAALGIERAPMEAGSPLVALRQFEEMVTKGQDGIELVAPVRHEQVKLADGRPGLLLLARFRKGSPPRLMTYLKMAVPSETHGHVVTAMMNSGPHSGRFLDRAGLTALLRAHLLTFVVDPAKLDRSRLDEAWSRVHWLAEHAVRGVAYGNHLVVQRKAHAQGISVYRRVLEFCPVVPAAHNTLAFTLASASDPALRDLEQAKVHAERAVELTAGEDPDSWDTLATVLRLRGEREAERQALTALLKLEPEDDGRWRARLTELGGPAEAPGSPPPSGEGAASPPAPTRSGDPAPGGAPGPSAGPGGPMPAGPPAAADPADRPPPPAPPLPAWKPPTRPSPFAPEN